METTRHFVGTVYVVHERATLLHRHDRLEVWLPPGGHLERDELPHEAADREALEETGLDVRLLADDREFDTGTVRSLSGPEHLLLEDVNVHDVVVGHQHVDFVSYGEMADRGRSPADDEATASARSLMVEPSHGVAVRVSERRASVRSSPDSGRHRTPSFVEAGPAL